MHDYLRLNLIGCQLDTSLTITPIKSTLCRTFISILHAGTCTRRAVYSTTLKNVAPFIAINSTNHVFSESFLPVSFIYFPIQINHLNQF